MSINNQLKIFEAIADSLDLMGNSRPKEKFTETKNNLALNMYKNALPYFKDKDVVEFEHTIIPQEKLQLIWSNLHVFSYDIENFFINEGIMHLMINGNLAFKIYFQIEDRSITLASTYKDTDELVCRGAIQVKDGKFHPEGWVADRFFPIYRDRHVAEGLPTDRHIVAGRLILDVFSNLIIMNQYVTAHKDVVIETSKRIPVTSNKKRKKHSPKKTKLIRTIKIDTEKAKKIYQRDTEDKREYERHTAQWTRRGHYRKLKDGTMKWIKPQVVKAKTKCKDTVVTKRVYQVN
jgi:hypothetical protein